MIFSTSYKEEGFYKLLTALIRIANPSIVVELGTQHGKSAVAIARGLREGQKLFAYDLFEETYRLPPYAPTRADFEQAKKNVIQAGVADRATVARMDAFEVHELFDEVDVLFVDICNYYDNVLRILERWHDRVAKLILLEGGVLNHWQKRHRFEPYAPVLEMDFVKDNYDCCIVRGVKEQAITILARKA